jgi:Skp family chaperone for outer membrane proteins
MFQLNPTMKTLPRILALTAGLLLSAGIVSAQTTGTPPERPGKGRVNKGPNENASDNAKAVHALLDQFKAQRDEMMAARRVLLERLKTATEEEKKAILEQLKAEQQDRVEEQRALGKQIRDELKKLREERKGGSTGG